MILHRTFLLARALSLELSPAINLPEFAHFKPLYFVSNIVSLALQISIDLLRIHKLYQTNWRLLLFIIWMQNETIHHQMWVSSSFRLEKFFFGTARIILNHGTSSDHLALLWKFFEAEDVLFGLCYTLKTVSIQSFLFPNCLRNQMSRNLRSLFHYVNFTHFFDSLIPDETIFFQPFSISLIFILYRFIYYFYLSRFIFNWFFCFD